MKVFNLHSYAKINLSLRIIKKLNNNFHKIESLVSFLQLSDTISIKEIKSKKDKIYIRGKFKKGIKINSNTLTKTLNIFRKNYLLKDRRFEIILKKNVPNYAGLGGGSMNSATLINFFIKKFKIRISKKKLLDICNFISSDVILGLEKKNSILHGIEKYPKRIKKRLNFFTILVFPNIKCSTRVIFSKNRKFSKSYKKFNQSLFSITNLLRDSNDLESVVFKTYPKIKKLNDFLKKQKNCIFSRMTGSGSICIGYFRGLRPAQKGLISIKKKYPKYWSVLSKTI